jgi:hypothetical protein
VRLSGRSGATTTAFTATTAFVPGSATVTDCSTNTGIAPSTFVATGVAGRAIASAGQIRRTCTDAVDLNIWGFYSRRNGPVPFFPAFIRSALSRFRRRYIGTIRRIPRSDLRAVGTGEGKGLTGPRLPEFSGSTESGSAGSNGKGALFFEAILIFLWRKFLPNWDLSLTSLR